MVQLLVIKKGEQVNCTKPVIEDQKTSNCIGNSDKRCYLLKTNKVVSCSVCHLNNCIYDADY